MKSVCKSITFLSFLLSAALTAYIMYGSFKGVFALAITILSIGISILCAYLYGIVDKRNKADGKRSNNVSQYDA